MQHKRLAFISFAIASLGAIIFSNNAFAASQNLTPPFDIGTTWYVCQGYNGPVTHQGTYALDITSAPNCDMNAPYGQNIRAPLDGTVAWYGAGAGSLCLNTTDGRSIGMYHINSSLKTSNKVMRGQIVGSLGAPYTVANGGIPHLHLEMWAAPGCSNLSQIIPFDTAHEARICGAPDFTAQGPDYYRNGTWSGTKFTTFSCSNDTQFVYRFWSPKNQHHFYTTSEYEASQIIANYSTYIWTYEGVSFSAPIDSECKSSSPVYRFWSNKNQAHFYTISNQEKQIIETNYDTDTWKFEGVAYCAYKSNQGDSAPLYRFWSPKLQGHFYTANEQEKNVIISTYPPSTWTFEGVAYYVK